MNNAWRRARLAIPALAVTGILVGCSAPSVEESPNGRIIAVAGQASEAHAQALLEGTAEWGDGGCLVVDGGETYLVMFPHGTTIDDNDEVVLPNGFRIAAGDDVALGGGVHSVDTTNSDLTAIPQECLTDDIFWASGEVGE